MFSGAAREGTRPPGGLGPPRDFRVPRIGPHPLRGTRAQPWLGGWGFHRRHAILMAAQEAVCQPLF